MRIGRGVWGLVVLLAATAAGATDANGADPGAAAVDTTSAPGPVHEIAALLDRMARAYGGREALAAFPGFRARGKVLSLASGVNGALRLDLSLEGDLRSEISYPHRTETRILSGRLAWSGGQHHQRPAEPEMAESMQLQYHRLAAPFELAAMDPAELSLAGHSEEGWVRLQHEWTSETRTLYEIDPDSGQIRRVRGEVGSGDDMMVFETESSDFRDVDGVLFPFRMATTISGHAAAEILLDRVVREAHFDPQRFLPTGSPGDM